MEKQNILFDLDDTLIHCNKYFNITIDQFVGQMIQWFNGHSITTELIKQKQLELDLIGVHKHGFIKERFAQSLVETYEYFATETRREKLQREIESILAIGSAVYDQEYEPFPYMEETLTKLQEEGHHLSIYTGGDALVQKLKVDQLGLERFFGKRIYISQHKNTKVLEEIIKENNLERNHTWMIGNSARTDVIPALEAGIHSIHIPTTNEWEFNKMVIDIVPKGAFLTLSSLIEVPPAIKEFAGGRL